MRTDRRLAAVVFGLAALAATSDDAWAMYNPVEGRFLQRDPGPEASLALRVGQAVAGGEYEDGMNRYSYVSAHPTGRLDPTGLWGPDVHSGLTLELARRAGIACAADVAAGSNAPDKDERDAPSSFKTALKYRAWARLLVFLGYEKEASALLNEAERLLRQAAEWHFPVDADGEVRPGSTAARDNVVRGIKKCDFLLFSEGLHTLQDSWSHQGKPYMEGLGHARSAIYIPRTMVYVSGVPILVGGYWVKLGGAAAALDSSADDVNIWPEDARAAGIETYKALVEFKRECPCACPEPSTATSSGDAEDWRIVEAWLERTKYPGRNKVE